MTSEPTKRPSVKPVIERITLVGEEMAANPNCKRSNGGGKGATFPSPCQITGGVGQGCRDSRGS